MEDTHNTPMTLEQLSNTYQQIQQQFNNAKAQVFGLHYELNATRIELQLTKAHFKLPNQALGLKQ